MSDKTKDQEKFQIMKEKYVALGNSDTSSEEWVSHVHRDTYNLMLHSSALLEYTSVANGTRNKFDTKLELIKKMKELEFANPEKRRLPEGDKDDNSGLFISDKF